MKESFSEIIQSKTDIRNILKYSISLFGLAVLILFLQVFVFWGIFGEGAESGRIADLWYVEYIMEFLPAIVIVGFILYKVLRLKNNYRLTKTYLITLIVFILLYVFRKLIIGFFIELFQ